MKPENIQPEDVTATFTVECAGCGDDETICAASKEAAANRFNSLGWQCVEGDVTCSECIESLKRGVK